MADKLIENIREDLIFRLDEWLGMSIPDEDDEDYEIWQERLEEIHSIKTIEDILSYVEAHLPDSDEFIKKWGLSK